MTPPFAEAGSCSYSARTAHILALRAACTQQWAADDSLKLRPYQPFVLDKCRIAAPELLGIDSNLDLLTDQLMLLRIASPLENSPQQRHRFSSTVLTPGHKHDQESTQSSNCRSETSERRGKLLEAKLPWELERDPLGNAPALAPLVSMRPVKRYFLGPHLPLALDSRRRRYYHGTILGSIKGLMVSISWYMGYLKG